MRYLFFLLGSISTLACIAQPANILANNPKIAFEEVVSGLRNPWGMAFLPNGDILVTEISGEVRVVRNGELLNEKIGGVPEVYVRGQGGLLDIELHPDFETNNWVYLTFSSTLGSGSGGNTTLARYRLIENQLTQKEILYKGVPNTNKGAHFGSRIVFDNKGYVYFSIGDRHNRDVNPQSLNLDGGKIYRLNEDGSIPQDNPFVNTSDAKPAIYSYGHRNPQGMAVHPETGEIWAHEHGPRGGDELNLILTRQKLRLACYQLWDQL
ncbi:MAG: PQQ-dependent sugar dehydrogenase [Cyclobacteriaceae bacterium]